MPKAKLSPDERRERRRQTCATYNAKNAETLRVKARERMRKLRASRKEAEKVVEVIDKQTTSVQAKRVPRLISMPQKKKVFRKFPRRKFIMKVEDDLAYDADSEGSEEERPYKLITARW